MDDPRKGKVVPVDVKIKTDYCLIEAKGLHLDLAAGRYWIGLTPISDGSLNGRANHLRTQGRSARGMESVVRQPEGDRIDVQSNQNYGQNINWLTLQKAFSVPFDETMAIKIEGDFSIRNTIAEEARLHVKCQPKDYGWNSRWPTESSQEDNATPLKARLRPGQRGVQAEQKRTINSICTTAFSIHSRNVLACRLEWPRGASNRLFIVQLAEQPR